MAVEDLEAKIRLLNDIEEIKQLQNHYQNSLIEVKWDEVVDCFAENGAVEFPEYGLNKGKAAVAKVFKEGINYQHIGAEMPIAVQPEITVEGNEAKGRWLSYIPFAKPFIPRKPHPDVAEACKTLWGTEWADWFQGFYDMEYIRENGKWKFKLLKWYPRLSSPNRDYKNLLKKVKVVWKPPD